MELKDPPPPKKNIPVCRSDCQPLTRSLPLALADGNGGCQDGSGDGQAPGTAEGHGHISGRYHDCGCAAVGQMQGAKGLRVDKGGG
eukprot:362589-Chlamydomonas_euryale.AAC.13